MEWRMTDVLKLIGLYKQFECLWNYKSSTYKRIDLKKNAWQQIAKEFDGAEDEVKKKIKSLRSAYVNEKKKVDNRKSGSSLEAAYESHLYYYADMSFLDSVVVLRATNSNLKRRSLELTSETDEAANLDEYEQSPLPQASVSLLSSSTYNSSTSSSAPSIPSLSSSSMPLLPSSSMPLLSSTRSNSKTGKKPDKFDKAIESIVANATTAEKETVFTSFAKTIALQLQQMSLRDATETMSEIHLLVTGKLIQTFETESIIEECPEEMLTNEDVADIAANYIFDS